MTLDVLICTIDQGILGVPQVILHPQEGIRWVVSMQYTDKRFLDQVPQSLAERPDVLLTFLPGKGLCRNRNNAIRHASGDILLIADDDCRYTAEGLRTIIKTYEEKPYADIICFAAESYDGRPMKKYPTAVKTYQTAYKEGYFPTSMEMTMRANLNLWFDERFGLGSEKLCAGEEEVFMKDAISSGHTALFVPTVIVHSEYETTGSRLIGHPRLQRTKGATFRYVFGKSEAIWRSVKEAGWWFVHKGANPFPILYNMLRGIWILQ